MTSETPPGDDRERLQKRAYGFQTEPLATTTKHRFVLNPELVRAAAERGQTIAVEFTADGLSVSAMTTDEKPAFDGVLSG